MLESVYKYAWELFLVFIGVIGLPYLLHAIWGRPKLVAHFESCDLESRTVLGCEVCNEPIENGWDRWVRRDAATGVTGSLVIEDRNAQHIVHAGPVDFETDNDLSGPMRKIDISPSDDGISIGIVDIFLENGLVCVHWKDKRITPGEYDVVISLRESGRSWQFSKGLQITEVVPYAAWIQL